MVCTPFWGFIVSFILFVLMLLSVPQVTVIPVSDMLTTDVNELTVAIGGFMEKVMNPEDL